jgi:hypothetical protein
MSTTHDTGHTDLVVKMILSSWDSQNRRINDFLNKVTDEQLYGHVSPGRNRGIYLFGHLISTTDSMMPLLDGGERLYPQLDTVFMKSPDNADEQLPGIDVLKQYWTAVNDRLNKYIATIPIEAWFTRHTAVSEDDFQKQPTRNKLNIIISRTTHAAYHFGQMIFLAPR